MAKKQQEYGNDSIRQLKGADRVRKRPAVIFGSDGVEGCAHSIFEIISNSIDEARDGHGNRINVTLFPDHVVEVEDFGRGIPVDYNKAEERWNWDLVFCELYAGGKYAEGSGNYDFSLGLNGLGLCATQYASEWMTADIYRDGFHYHLDFKKGGNVGGLQKEPFKGKRTGSVIRWKPDTEVFTDIAVRRNPSRICSAVRPSSTTALRWSLPTSPAATPKNSSTCTSMASPTTPTSW